MKQSKISVALVYDKVNTPYGGAEHVLKAIKQAFPNAPLFTSVYDEKAAIWAKDFKIYTTFLQKIPFFKKYHHLLASLMPLAFESLDLSDYDLIISITSAEAKGVITKPHQTHVCYMLTPPRYLYSHKEDYLDSHWFTQLPILRQVARLLLKYLTWWDKTAAHRPDFIIPISKLVQSRIRKYYHLATQAVIYPPVPKITSQTNIIPKLPASDYYLTTSRLVSYKRIDLAIQACIILNKKLIVVGTGLDRQKLQELAGNAGIVREHQEKLLSFLKRGKDVQKLIFFTRNINSTNLSSLINHSKALLMPGIEDFGISALQAIQLGKPVIIHAESGAAELLRETKHAIFIKRESVSEVVDAIKKLEKTTINPEQLRKHAEQYSPESFTTYFRKKVYDLFIKHQKRKDGHELS